MRVVHITLVVRGAPTVVGSCGGLQGASARSVGSHCSLSTTICGYICEAKDMSSESSVHGASNVSIAFSEIVDTKGALAGQIHTQGVGRATPRRVR